MTVVYVAYGVDHIGLGWIPAGVPVVVVHNDDRLAREQRPGLVHLGTGANVGFGAGVNLALRAVETERVLICNPDLSLTREHFAALAAGDDEEIVTLPLVDDEGRATSVANRYPTPLILLLTVLRVGRWVPRHSPVRRLLSRLLGRWGRVHAASLDGAAGDFPLEKHWASGAVLSMASARLRGVGGFDPGYFLYFEDTDLAARLAARWPSMRVRVAEGVPPARHTVGGSARAATDRLAANQARWASAARYAASQRGWRWRLVAAGLRGRSRWGGR